jgi:integrase/recombinase XerD
VALEALNTCPRYSATYYFWTGTCSIKTAVRHWQEKLSKIFTAAGVSDGHPHRLRDSFAVGLLLAGLPIEEVSQALGHSDIRVTLRHYAPWVQARQQRLENHIRQTWTPQD